jgi:hypothetical protein
VTPSLIGWGSPGTRPGWAIPLAAWGSSSSGGSLAALALRRCGGSGGGGAADSAQWGSLLALLALLAGGGVGVGSFVPSFPRFHAEVGLPDPRGVPARGWYVGRAPRQPGCWPFSWSSSSAMRRWFAPAALAVGAAGLPVVLGSRWRTAVAAPARRAWSFQLPALVRALAVWVAVSSWGVGSRAAPPGWLRGPGRWLLLALPVVVPPWFLSWCVEGVVLAMGLWVGIALAGGPPGPGGDGRPPSGAGRPAGEPNGWWAPLAGRGSWRAGSWPGGLLTGGARAPRSPSPVHDPLRPGPGPPGGAGHPRACSAGTGGGDASPGSDGGSGGAPRTPRPPRTPRRGSSLPRGPRPPRPRPSGAHPALDAGASAGWRRPADPLAEPDAQSAFLLPGAWRSAPAPPVALPAPRIERLASGVRSTPAVPWGGPGLALERGGAEGSCTWCWSRGRGAPSRIVSVAMATPVPAGPRRGSAGARRPVTRVSYQGIPAVGRREALLLEVERLAPTGSGTGFRAGSRSSSWRSTSGPRRGSSRPEAFPALPSRAHPTCSRTPGTRSDRALLVRTRVSLPLDVESWMWRTDA